MSRRLVTGATGFIGGHLVARLTAQGHAVRCLVRRSSDTTHLPAAGVELIVGDVSDASAVERAVQGCDIVYHLAGKTSARHAAELYRVNVGGCEQVARACAAQNTPPLLILVSSLAAAGPCPPQRLITERDPARPVSDYGRSKYAGECATWSWADRIPLSIVRPAIVFGPRNRDMLPIFQVIQRLGVHAVPGMTPRRVSLIHQEDLLEILDRVVRVGQRVKPRQPGPAASEPSEDAAGIYFAAAPEQPTYAELGRMIGPRAGSISLAGPATARAARLADRRRPPVRDASTRTLGQLQPRQDPRSRGWRLDQFHRPVARRTGIPAALFAAAAAERDGPLVLHPRLGLTRRHLPWPTGRKWGRDSFPVTEANCADRSRPEKNPDPIYVTCRGLGEPRRRPTASGHWLLRATGFAR